jgi:Na+/H+ antiporter NhaC
MYLPQRIMNLYKYFASIIKGIVDMLPLLVIIILAYSLQEANTGLGLTDFVIGGALTTISPALLPAMVFIVIGLLSFASGTFWGLAIIAFPIVAPLAEAVGANPLLCAGAVVSAVCFGGHICIYSDTVILTAASTQTTNVDYFKSSFPLVAVPALLAVIAFLILGAVMA